MEDETTEKNIIKRFIESESFQEETEIFLVNDQSQQKELEIKVKFDNNHRQDLNSKQLKRNILQKSAFQSFCITSELLQATMDTLLKIVI